MYQIKICADSRHRDWITQLYDSLKAFVTEKNGVIFTSEEKDRVFVSVGAQVHPQSLKKKLKEEVCNLFLSYVKRSYLCDAIEPFARNRYLLRVYLYILSGLNRTEEYEFLRSSMLLSSHFALDGYYRFRMEEVRRRWDELIELTAQNGDLLQEDGSFSLLLKYMLSCLPSKTDCAYVDYDEGRFCVSARGEMRETDHAEEVILFLVDLAPNKIALSKKATNTDLDDKISGIFDAEFV